MVDTGLCLPTVPLVQEIGDETGDRLMPTCSPMEVVSMVMTITGTLIKNDPQVNILNADPHGRLCQSLLRLVHIESRFIVQEYVVWEI